MNYENVLRYVRRILENSNVRTILCDEAWEHPQDVDMGLRISILKDYDSQKAFLYFKDRCRPNTLYYITDRFSCSYACMMLPNPQKKEYFFVGPFTYVEINQKNYYKILENMDIPTPLLPFVNNYYYSLPLIQSESLFKNIVGTFADTVWEGSENYKISETNEFLFDSPYTPQFLDPVSPPSEMIPLNAAAIEARYASEAEFMQIVSQGNISHMEQILAKWDRVRFIPRLPNSLRDYKNYLIVLNTLLRKAAEQGSVHPVYLHEISSKYAKKIEALGQVSDNHLMREMLRQYCILVHNYSVKGYSPILQKVINQINLNLTGDLGLRNLSEMFNISAGYLSMLFKKETGVTLTDYVNKKRTQQAIFLLNTTNLQIQAVASHCGFQDINYFTRIFKKFHGMTPKSYQKIILEHKYSSMER